MAKTASPVVVGPSQGVVSVVGMALWAVRLVWVRISPPCCVLWYRGWIEVCWIHTGGVFAKMVKHQAIRDQALEEFVGEAVRLNPYLSDNEEGSIAHPCLLLKDPASRSLLNPAPKSFSDVEGSVHQGHALLLHQGF